VRSTEISQKIGPIKNENVKMYLAWKVCIVYANTRAANLAYAVQSTDIRIRGGYLISY
jgi:hypothetical protein